MLPGIGWLVERLGGDSNLRVIRYHPGRRLVVREVRRPGESVFWKLYATGRVERIAEAHQAVRALSLRGELGCSAPELAGYWPDDRALALLEAHGRPIATLPPADTALACAAAGLALASLHDSSWHPPREWALVDEAEVLVRSVASMRSGDDALDDLAVTLATEAIRGWTESSAPDVPLHRNFHPGQVLDTGGDPAVLDWDDTAMGDSRVDVSNFVAHLLLEGVRAPERAAEWRTGAKAFLDAYTCGVGRPAALGCFIAATLVRLATQSIAQKADIAEASTLLSLVREPRGD